MDRKVFIQALLWSLVAFMMWITISQYLRPPPQRGTATRPVTDVTPAAPTGDGAAVVDGSPTTVVAASEFRPVGVEDEVAVSLGNGDAGEQSPFRMALDLSNRGASIRSADLSDFAEEVNQPQRYRLLQPATSQGREFLSLTIENVNINGRNVPLGDSLWRASKSSDDGKETATFEIDVVDKSDAPVLRLTRMFRLSAQPAGQRRSDLHADLTVENLTDEPFDIRVSQHGPIGVRQAYSRTEDRFVYAAHVPPEEPGVVALEGKAFGSLAKTSEPLDTPLLWTGVGNKYFSCVLVPLSADGSESPPCIEGSEALKLGDRADTLETITSRVVSHVSLAPGARWEQKLECYLGANDRKAFAAESNPDYRRRDFRQIISVQYGSCAFGWLTDLMILFLDGLDRLFGNYGVAIIFLVLVVRAVLHPVTKKGQVSMVRMQERMGKLQPKTELLKEKFGNDKTRLQQETMKLYQEEGINPATSMLGSCLPMGLQMPIWIALYTSLSNNIAMRHQGFVSWINDLTAPDALIPFASPYQIPILGWKMTAFNLLPILLTISMILQQKLMPKPQPPKTTAKSGANPQMDQAAQMQKMMPFMSVFFGIILYNMPSGLNLYIMASNVFGTIEQWRIRKHIKEVKEKGLDAQVRRKTDLDAPKKPSWFARKLRGLQKRAEEAQRMPSHRKTPKR